MVVFEAFLVFEAPWKNHECMKKLPLCCVKMIACNQNVSLKKKRTPYVMKDFLHNESCLEKYYACWQGSLISMVYFDKLTYFFGDNLVFILHFSVIGNFDKCISHHTLTKFSSFKQKCEHESITVFSGQFLSFFHVKFARFRKQISNHQTLTTSSKQANKT